MEEPIVILGNQRSGTSLTRQILTNHSQIAIPPESHFFAFLEDKFEGYDNIRIEVYINLLRNCQKIEHWGLDFDHLHEYLLERKLKNYADVIAETYKYWGIINGKVSFMWGDKNSLWFEKLDIYKKYYEPKVVHLIRDPRDIAVSYLHLSSSRFDSTYAPKLTTSIREIGEKWNRNNNRIRELYGDGKYVCIRYEDIVLKPELTVDKLLKFIGVETDLTIVDVRYHTILEPQETLQWKTKLLGGLARENVRKYKHSLQSTDIRTLESVCEDWMRGYGYL